MALFELFGQGDGAFDQANPNDGQVAFANEGLIEISIGTVTVDIYGSFLYDAFGRLAGGVFNTLEIYDYAHGGLQARLSGLYAGVDIFASAAASPDPDYLEAALLSGTDTLVGSAGDDSLDGWASADSLVGGGGNDTLNGGSESFYPGYRDTLVGGAGNDTYVLQDTDLGKDVIVEEANGGIDTVITSLDTYVLPAYVENLVLTNSSGAQGTGNELDNRLAAGGGGAVRLYGLAGNDTLVGTASSSEGLIGGPGNDTYELHGGDWSLVTESAGEGVDTVIAFTDAGLAPNVENLVLVDKARQGFGNSLPNVITGNASGDTLNGSGGADTLIGGAGNDTFIVDQAGDVLVGNGGNDTVVANFGGYVLPDGLRNLQFTGLSATGNAADNYIVSDPYPYFYVVINALAGNDTIVGTHHYDTIDGGEGLDHAVYQDSITNYVAVCSGNQVTLSQAHGGYYSVLLNVERVDFPDGSLAFDVSGNAGMAYRLYQAAFDRKPDVGGLGYQMHDLDIGVSLEQVASNFIASPEFQRTYGNVDDTQFLTLLYQNVLHRAPDAGGLQFHLDEMHVQGQSRAMELVHFSESPENQANVIGDIQDGMVFLPFSG